MILFELLANRPSFPPSLSRQQIACLVTLAEIRPAIPDSVLPEVRALIEDCWASDHECRPTFHDLVDRLVDMDFKVTANVNSVKIGEFVQRINV
jgi:hypothetical protein